jgi:AcrR family transcriptional regulator
MAKRKSATDGHKSPPASSSAGHAPIDGFDEESPRPRGRPRTEIDSDAVADAVAGLFVEGGMDAVSIVSAARKLDVSRATLYRAVPTKEDLLGILFERSTRELTELVSAAMEAEIPVAERLRRMVELQVDAAVRMRHYLSVFFGGADLPADVVDRWRPWTREYEGLWTKCVEEAMDAGVLARSNVVAATRLVLGMCIWVSRWYRPSEGIETADIAESAIALLFPHGQQHQARR